MSTPSKPSEPSAWAMREAREALPCHCEEAWTSRGMHDPACARDYAPDVADALDAAYARGCSDALKCFTCRGSGRITILHTSDPGFHDEPCPECCALPVAVRVVRK